MCVHVVSVYVVLCNSKKNVLTNRFHAMHYLEFPLACLCANEVSQEEDQAYFM
jgi:hypothetical protein